MNQRLTCRDLDVLRVLLGQSGNRRGGAMVAWVCLDDLPAAVRRSLKRKRLVRMGLVEAGYPGSIAPMMRLRLTGVGYWVARGAMGVGAEARHRDELQAIARRRIEDDKRRDNELAELQRMVEAMVPAYFLAQRAAVIDAIVTARIPF